MAAWRNGEYHLVENQRNYLGMKTYLDLNELKQLEEQAGCLRDRLLIRLLARLGSVFLAQPCSAPCAVQIDATFKMQCIM